MNKLKIVYKSVRRTHFSVAALTRVLQIHSGAHTLVWFSKLKLNLQRIFQLLLSATSYKLQNNIRVPLITILILLIIFGLIPNSRETTRGAYTATSVDVDGNNHLANNTVNDTTLYDTSLDSSADTQQQLGIDPNWKSGITRGSSALKFDGSSTYIGTAGDAVFNFSTNDFTLEAWVKTNATPAGNIVIMGKYSGSGNDYWLGMNTSGNIVFNVTGALATSSNTINDNKWHHVIGEKRSGYVYVYVDGIERGSTLNNNSASPGSTFTIGRFNASFYFNGLIDEVRVSNIARYTSAFTSSRRFVEDINTVGLWHFDEGTGVTVNDSSQYGNNGDLTGHAPTWVTGSNAVTSSGSENITLGENSSTTNDKGYDLKITPSPGLQFTAASSQYVALTSNPLSGTTYTVDAWFKATSVSNGYTIFSQRSSSSATPVSGQLYFNGNKICFIVRDDAGNVASATGATVLTAGVWYHAAGVRNGKDVSVYLNGVRDGNAAAGGGIGVISSDTKDIGRYNSGGSPAGYFGGIIDEVRTSNVVRYYNNFTPSKRYATDGSTTGLWHFDEGTGNSVLDISGNANTGDLTGHAPAWADGISASGNSNSSTNWALPGYQFRKQLKITNNVASDLGSGYGLENTENRATLMDNKQMRADGNDTRIIYQPPNAKRGLGFDGNSDYANTVDIDSIDNASYLTYSAWVKVNTLNDWSTVVAKYSSSSNRSQMTLAGSGVGGNDDVFVTVGNGENSYGYTNSNIISVGVWNLWTMVYDGSQSTNSARLKFYLNGVQQSLSYSGTIPATTATNAETVKIGAERPNYSYLIGSVDETRIYNRALSASEVSALYNGGIGTNGQIGAGLVGWWKMDEGSGQIIRDYSGNDNNGTLGADASANTDDPTWSTDGVVSTAQEVPRFIPHGHALSFDGSGDRVRNSTQIITASPFTVDFWYKPTNFSATYTLFAQGSTSASNIAIKTTTGNKVAFMVDGATLATGNTSLVANSWYHIMLTHDANASPKSVLYLNGAKELTQNISTVFTGANITLGASSKTSQDEIAVGIFDEVRISNVVRTRNNFSPSIYPYPIDSNTRLLWHLDDGSGNAIDNSGNGYTGTVTNATWSLNSGKVDSISQTQFKTVAPITASASDSNYYLYYGNLKEASAAQSYQSYGLKFDGTNDGVGVQDNSNLNSSYTSISAWIKIDTWKQWASIYNRRTAGNIGGVALSLYSDVGSIIFYSYISGGWRSNVTTGWNTGQWYHIVAIYNGTAMTVYRDGVPVDTPTNIAGTINSPTDPGVGIGITTTTTKYYYKGSIDDLRVYNRAISTAEITGLFSNSPYVSNSGLVGWWKMDDGSTAANTTVADSSGSGGVGTLTNFNFNNDSNWVANSGLLHASTEPTITNVLASPEQESPIFYSWRQAAAPGGTPAAGAWSTVAQISPTLQQLGSEGVYIRWNPQVAYSLNDYYRVSSWAVEAYTTSAPARGKLRSFPAKANLIANNGGLDIIDAATNTLWMRFPIGANSTIFNSSVLSVEAKNGRIYLSSSAAFMEIKMDADYVSAYSTAGSGFSISALSLRDNNVGYDGFAGLSTNSTGATNASVQVIGTNPPMQVVAISQPDSISVIKNITAVAYGDKSPSGTTIYDYSANANDAYSRTSLTTAGTVYGANTTHAGLDVYTTVHNDTADQKTSSDLTYSTTSTPALRSNAINDISVTTGTSAADNASNQVALATDLGAEVIHEHSTQASGYIEHFTNTGTIGTSNHSSKQFGNALKFDGTDDYVTLSEVNLTGQAVFSVEAKILLSHVGEIKMIVSKQQGGVDYPEYQLAITNSNKVSFGFATANNPGGWSEVVSANGLSINTWYHLAGVYDGAQMRVYINGNLDGSPVAKTGTPYDNNDGTQIGKRKGINPYPMQGTIDEVRISNLVRYTSNFTPSSTSYVTDANTLGLWHMDERTGQYIYDASGNNYNGTLGANVTPAADDPLFVSPSISGSDKVSTIGTNKVSQSISLVFDGNNDYITVPSFNQSFTSATFVAWVKPTAYLQYGYGLVFSRGLATGMSLGPSNTTRLGYHWNDSGDTWGWGSGPVVPLNSWSLAVVTVEPTRAIAYVGNAGTISSAINSVNHTSATVNRLKLGYDKDARYFPGEMDNVQIYNRALTGSEVAALYNGGMGRTDNPSSGIVGWWKMNEGSGQTVTDSSGSGNNGTLGGSSSPASDDPTWATGSPVKEQSALWVGTNGAGANDGAVTAISQATGRQITSYTTANSSLPDNDVSSLSLGSGGLALVGTEAGAWPAGMAGFVVEDQASTPANIVSPLRLKGNNVRIKSGVRLK